MSKDFAIKCPTQGICHHTDEQHEHDEMDVAAVHDFIHGIREFYTLGAGSANVCSAHLVRLWSHAASSSNKTPAPQSNLCSHCAHTFA
jgi:hypothetical protein